MSRNEVVIGLVIVIVCSVTVAVGGVFHPNTLAGAVARFFFSI